MIRNPYAALAGLPRSLWVLFWATLAQRVGMMAHPFLALYGTQQLGFTEGRAGLLVGVCGLGGIVAAMLGGLLSDRYGGARVLTVALTGAGTLMLLVPALGAGPAVFVSVFVWGLIGEMGRPAAMSVLAHAVGPEDRRRAMAAYRLAINLGMSIGPTLGGFLAGVSFLLLFRVDAAAALTAAAFVGVGLRVWRRPVARDDSAPRVPLRAALRDRRLGLFLAGFALLWGAFVLDFAPLSLHLVRNLGYPTRLYGMLVALNTVLIVLFEVPLTGLTRAWTTARTFAVGGALIAAGLLIFTWGTLPAFAAGIVVMAFGEMLAMTGAAPFVTALAPEGRTGAYVGAYSLSAGLAMAASPAIGAWMLGHAPAGWLWTGGALTAAVGTGLMVLAARESPLAPSVTS